MIAKELKLVKIGVRYRAVYENLAQAYEAEFSSLTGKMPDENGFFKIDTLPLKPYTGYLLFYQKHPIGFCVAETESDLKDIAEFYIIPVMRKKNFGYQLAKMVFDRHPGQWQVRQINGANDAISFWRAVVRNYTHNQFNEAVVNDPYWGVVTRQQFCTADHLSKPSNFDAKIVNLC
jgi:predicted acetyltransferase